MLFNTRQLIRHRNRATKTYMLFLILPLYLSPYFRCVAVCSALFQGSWNCFFLFFSYCSQKQVLTSLKISKMYHIKDSKAWTVTFFKRITSQSEKWSAEGVPPALCADFAQEAFWPHCWGNWSFYAHLTMQSIRMQTEPLGSVVTFFSSFAFLH